MVYIQPSDFINLGKVNKYVTICENKAYNQALEDVKKELIKIYNKRYMHDIYLDDIDDIVDQLKK